MSVPAALVRRKYPGLNLDHDDARAQQDAESVMFGFWVFVMSDAVLFALLLSVYETLMTHTAGGPSGSDLFKMKSAFLETVTLLMSSFVYGLCTLAVKYRAKRIYLYSALGATLALGLIFLGLEVHDFMVLGAQGAVPQRSAFLSAFYTLVATHFVHVFIGCLWIVVMLIQVRVFGLSEQVRTRLLRLGIFWHFLDVIWVLIFSFVYLQGMIPWPT
ncbi:MAG TPA: cytochrome c oxidase subunit 3 [Acidiferrobacteraceae bacterium]|nr:cytochrome c oxidase subunit 3 [Acidiferrobacteraceae bacterium]